MLVERTQAGLSIVAKRSPISATAEHLLKEYCCVKLLAYRHQTALMVLSGVDPEGVAEGEGANGDTWGRAP